MKPNSQPNTKLNDEVGEMSIKKTKQLSQSG
jgi:hypothetical protein